MAIAVDWDVKPQTKQKPKSWLLDQILIIFLTLIQNLHFGTYIMSKKIVLVKKYAVLSGVLFGLTLCLLVSSADNLCKQFGPRSGLTEHWAWSGSKLFDILMVILKEVFEKSGFWKKSAGHKK